jgi:hypothetical protein
LPLGVNEAAGQWNVVVRELLANNEGAVAFTYQPPVQCGAVAGAVPRAVCLDADRENIFRFLALYKDITIVKGTGDYDSAAAERLETILKPWNVRAKIVAAAEVNKPRPISEEEAPAWCGLEPGRVKAGDKNNPVQVGFDVRGPVVLLGTPEDNPLIKFLLDQRFLPYRPEKGKFPGPGRGMLAWQRDGVGYWQESVTLLAHDEAGMSEAVGTLYELAAGLDPLMRWTPPASAAVTPAGKAPAPLAEARQAWQASFPDRAVALKAQPNGNVIVLTQDGTLAALNPAGGIVWRKTVECGENPVLGAAENAGVLAVGAGHHLVVCDGNGTQLCDMPSEFDAPGGKKETSAINAVAVAPDEKSIAVAAANGKLLLVDPKGRPKWAAGGVTPEDLAKYETELKAWEAGAAEREAALKQFTDAEARWKADVQQWEAGGKKGPQPVQPKRPNQPGRPNKPLPTPYLAVCFASDGNTLLAITKDQGHLFSVADGKMGEKVGGVAPIFSPLPVGGNLLVSDGRERLALLSPADGKVQGEIRFTQSVQAPGKKPGEMQTIKDAPVSAALLKDRSELAQGRLIVATEFDGSVRALKEVKGKLEEQTNWSFTTPLRVTKKIAAGDGILAVGYWGGTLRVLDATGALKFGQKLPQDIAALVCSGKMVICGTADGKVSAFEAR